MLAASLTATRAYAQDLDLRWDDETVGPRRDEAEIEAPEDAEPPAEEAPPSAEPSAAEAPTVVVLPDPPPEPRRAARATPISPVTPEVSYRGQRAPNLYAFFQAGARTGGGLGVRLSPHLAAGGYVQRFPWALTFGNAARSNARIDFTCAYVLGAVIEHYPGSGVLQLRGALGAGLFYARRTEQNEFGDEIRTGLGPRMMPNASIGLGGQWRPSDAFGRFRLGLLFETGASTTTYRGDRVLFMDFSISTTVTWF